MYTWFYHWVKWEAYSVNNYRLANGVCIVNGMSYAVTSYATHMNKLIQNKHKMSLLIGTFTTVNTAWTKYNSIIMNYDVNSHWIMMMMMMMMMIICVFCHLQQLYGIFSNSSLQHFSRKLPSSSIMILHFLNQIGTAYSVCRSHHTLLHLLFVSSLFTPNILLPCQT